MKTVSYRLRSEIEDIKCRRTLSQDFTCQRLLRLENMSCGRQFHARGQRPLRGFRWRRRWGLERSVLRLTWQGEAPQLLLWGGAPQTAPLVLPHLDLGDGDPLRDGGDVDLQDRDLLSQYSGFLLNLLSSLQGGTRVSLQSYHLSLYLLLILGPECGVSQSLSQRIYFVGKLCRLDLEICLKLKSMSTFAGHTPRSSHFLWRSVSYYDGLHLDLKRLHSYFVLFVQFISQGVAILELELKISRSCRLSPAPGPLSSPPLPAVEPPSLSRPANTQGGGGGRKQAERSAFRMIYINTEYDAYKSISIWLSVVLCLNISRHKMTDKVSTVTSWIFCLI